jgi:hypothetical protein
MVDMALGLEHASRYLHGLHTVPVQHQREHRTVIIRHHLNNMANRNLKLSLYGCVHHVVVEFLNPLRRVEEPLVLLVTSGKLCSKTPESQPLQPAATALS